MPHLCLRKMAFPFLSLPFRSFDFDVGSTVAVGPVHVRAARIVASVEEPQAIRAILAHVEKHGVLEQAHYRPRPRGPPAAALAA